mmetsp:Transcript_9895/g.27911  ORF Transcript_9895/g.27911 Transcript_9895/m.27911 type:complete len:266 (-) Transcript_9895:188-985(-)
MGCEECFAARGTRKGHLHVKALFHGGAVCGSPIRHYKSLESQLILQVPQSDWVLAAVSAIEPVVTAHHGTNTALNGALKWRIVHLKQSTLINVLAHSHAVRLLAVADEMLAAGDDVVLLDADGDRLREDVSEVGVLPRQVFEVAAIDWHARQVQARSKLHVGALLPELPPHGGAPSVDRLGVPRRRHGHGPGPRGRRGPREGLVAEPLRPVVQVERRDAQAGDARDVAHVGAGHAGAVQHLHLLQNAHLPKELVGTIQGSVALVC